VCIGIILDKRTTVAWKAVGEVGRPVGYKVIMARMKWINQWHQNPNKTFCANAATC